MPRFQRSYIQTTYFHVITQGLNKSYIFDEKEDIEYYIELMERIAKKETICLLAYCIMNNHAHMLLQTDKIENLSKYMHKINSKYAKYYNNKHKRVGYVFRDRYKSEGIYSEEQLCNCINYIHNNPVKAGLCNQAKEYPYSDCNSENKIIENGYIFLDVDNEDIGQEIIEEFLIENNLKINELKNNEVKLKELLLLLKRDNDISLRKISQFLQINRERVRKLYKN